MIGEHDFGRCDVCGKKLLVSTMQEKSVEVCPKGKMELVRREFTVCADCVSSGEWAKLERQVQQELYFPPQKPPKL